jgi:hypothetical protein
MHMRHIFIFLSIISINNGQMILNEIMVNPSGSEYENEFVEIFNLYNQKASLDGWLLSDGNSTDTLILFSGPDSINALSYALIIDPDLIINGNIYFDTWPDLLTIYTLKNNSSFGSGGFSNSNEQVILLTPENVAIDSFSWSMASDNGYSWERIFTDSPSILESWEQSTSYNGTPGQTNSVTPPEFGFQIDSMMTKLYFSTIDTTVGVTIYFHNLGQNALYFADVSIHYENNTVADSIQNGAWEMNQSDSLELNFSWLKSGQSDFTAELSMHDSLDAQTASFQIKVPFRQNAITITEILFAPNSEEGSEFFELQNISPDTISLKNWRFKDAGTTWRLFSETDIHLAPNSFLVCAQSQLVLDYFNPPSLSIIPVSWSALNASSDSIIISDLTGKIISSAFYSGSWGENGKSLERRHHSILPYDASNWKTSQNIDGATPGLENSVNLLQSDIGLASWDNITINPIAPGSVRHSLLIKNIGYETIYSMAIQLQSNSDDALVLNWEGILQSFGELPIVFTSYELTGGPIQLQLTLQIADTISRQFLDSINIGYPSQSIIFTEFLAIPGSNQVEFLECQNMMQDSINLSYWTIQDRTNSATIPYQLHKIAPDDFIVFTSDASVFDVPTEARVIEINSWLSLNNTSDDFVLFDAAMHVQDSLFYTTNFPLTSGFSAERRAEWLPSNVASSWGLTEDINQHSAGKINSIWIPEEQVGLTLKSRQQKTSSLDTIQLELLIEGLGHLDGDDITIRVDGFGASQWLQHEVPEFGHMESIFLDFPPQIPSWNTCIASIERLNISDTLILGIEPIQGDIRINEFMVYPESGESEWLEIMNYSDNDIPLNLLSISDNSHIIPIISSAILLAGEMAIFSDFYNDAVCREVLISPWPGFGNSSDAIKILSLSGDIVDSLQYNETWPIQQGVSMERLDLSSETSFLDNWERSPYGQSMCQRNTSLPPLSNLEIRSIRIDGKNIVENENFRIEAIIRNTGLNVVSSEIESFMFTEIGDTIWNSNMPISIPKQDSLLISFDIDNIFSPGFYTFLIRLPLDDILEDNFKEMSLFVGFENSPIILSEFQIFDSPVGEWIELVNTSEEAVSLEGWFISDFDKNMSMAFDSLVIPPVEYIVFSKEFDDMFPSVPCEHWPEFKNETDGIFLFAPDSSIQDSLIYNNDWSLNPNFSCERISWQSLTNDANNWNTSISPQGHSAGEKNSLHLAQLPKAINMRFSENPWHYKGMQSNLLIHYDIPYPSAFLTVEIYDLSGRMIKTLKRNEISSHKGILTWNGVTDWNRRIATGLYIVYFHAMDNQQQSETVIQKFAVYVD